MANRLLLQTLVKFRDGIKSGAAKVSDVIEDYFRTTGKQPTEDERALILSEFAKDAPSGIEAQGVEEVFFGPGDLRLGGKKKGPNVQKAGEMSDTPGTDKVEDIYGVTLRGDESFGELTEKLGPAKEEGLGSLFPKGKTDSIFDQKNSNRAEVAAFMKAMREAGIKNEDIQKVIKEETFFERQPARRGDPDAPKEVVNLGQGKKAATTLARAADMSADTKIKQELLADLDDDIANYGPNWWRGEGYNDGPMGYDSYGAMSRNVVTKINNGIVDDLENAGVSEEKVSEIFRGLSTARDRLANNPKAFVQKVADELEFENINYDLSFWNKYVDEIMSRVQKPEPRFEYGGMV